MIQSFKCGDTKALYETGKSKKFSTIKKVAERKFQMLDAAATLDFLKSPPGSHLVALVGDLAGRHSIRINIQWHVCFVWTALGPMDVEIIEYCNPEVAKQNESDGFVPRARRKPQRRLAAFARVATPPWVRRRAFMFRYFRVAVLALKGQNHDQKRYAPDSSR